MSRVDGFVGHRRRLVLDWVNFSRAAQHPHTAQVDVSLLFEVIESETLQQRQGIVIRVVIMPLKSLGMVEENVAWQRVVTVDNVPVVVC